ncbi:50S ribosomal protein L25 [Candidatus Latescibacterota bacterium]
MAEAILNANNREESGKQAVKKLRSEGLIPATLYGPGVEPSSLSINRKELTTLLHSEGRNVIVDLTLDNGKKKVKTFIYEIQHDPLSDKIIHVDLKHIDLKDKIRVEIPVHLEGIPEGVKNEGGISEHILHTIEVSCLPTDIPSEIVIDVSALQIGDAIHVKDLPGGDFEFLSDADRTVVHVIAPRVVIVEEEEEELEEGLEGEIEGEEGEGGEVEGEEAAEPEVIGKKSDKADKK